MEKQIQEMEVEQNNNVINNARRLSQLKRKYLELKIATWIYRKMKPNEEEEQVQDEPSEPVVPTTEELEMIETLRKSTRTGIINY